MPDVEDPSEKVAESVWLTGQVCSRDQRRGRYLPGSMAHPGKMLPSIARHAITTYTDPGDVVLDPMCGIGTTIVEATHLGRDGIGIEYEQRWAELASANLQHAAAQGATGRGQVWWGDARHLPAPLPAEVRGQVALVLTSPPYGPSTHGHVREHGSRHGKLAKINHRYGTDPDNLAHHEPDHLTTALATILTGCVTVLRPGGYIVITARPYRRTGELIDIPGIVTAAAQTAGLHLVDRCVALIAGIRDGLLIPRASFFQLHNIRTANTTGNHQWLVAHEDVLVVQKLAANEPGGGVTRAPDMRPASTPDGQDRATDLHGPQDPPRAAIARADHCLDASAPSHVDRCPEPAHPAIVHPCDGATEPVSDPDRESGRTPDSWPRHPRPMTGSTPADATAHQRPPDRDATRPQGGPSNRAGRR